MEDLISRQAAIDALWEIRQKEILDGRRFHNHCSLSTAVDVIKDLPSAQPEIIRCKDCKWNMGDCCVFETYAASDFDENGFCSNAERG